jgi:putative nucleotidyltransferase with HDIG domain
MTSEYIIARKSQLNFYNSVPLYNKVGDDKYVLYKPSGITLGGMRLNESRHPGTLYIKAADKILGIKEAQEAFNKKLETNIKSGNLSEIKDTLVTIMEETLTEPRSGSLEGISNTMDILNEYVTTSDVLKNLLNVSSTDYSTIMHSINVMTFALGFAVYSKYSKADTKTIGLAALLHDVGKTQVSLEILTAPRKLTDEEFQQMEQHTVIGHNILKKCRFDSKEIYWAALDHHEKLDKSGYPNGKGDISEMSHVISIIDCYEALTNDDRPYRSAMPAYKALELIKKDVEVGKFGKQIYEKFIRSLVSAKIQKQDLPN